MNALSTFNFNTSAIRVVTIDGNPWFVASDVCRVLGFKNPTVSLKALDADERAKTDLGPIAPTANIISESGLYKLVMRSDKPQAKPFQDWVAKIVLPAIRKDGGYIFGQENMTSDEFVRAAKKFAGRKPRTVAAEGTLWYCLQDLIPPSLLKDYSRGACWTRAFVRTNAPEGSVSKRRMTNAAGYPSPTIVVSADALPTVLTYITGKMKGIDFRASWAKLPEPLQMSVAA